MKKQNSPAISYRPYDKWFDEEKSVQMFGVQAKVVGAQVRWLHCCHGGKPLVFFTAAERDIELKKLRKKL